MFESHYRRRHVVLPLTSHSYTYASTGTGKLVTAIANIGCTIPSSAILCSPKPQLADMLCGRRQDPRLFESSRPHGFTSDGIDIRGISSTVYHLPGGRCFVIDPAGESVFPSSGHTLTSEIDPNSDDAAAIIKTIARGSIVNDKKVTEPFFMNAAFIFFTGLIADSRTRFRDPAQWTLPAIADRSMGMDREGRCDPDVLKQTLIDMASNNAFGGLPQAASHLLLSAAGRTMGSIIAQMQTALAWIVDPQMRKHLTRPSEFSYREVGVDDAHPVTVFLIPRPTAQDEAKPHLRTHLEVALAIMKTRKVRAKHGLWVCLDEYRSYGGPDMEEISKGFTILREANVFLDVYTQSFPSLQFCVGEDGVAEIEACGSASIYGVHDIETAERVSRILGSRTARYPNGSGRACALMSPQEILRDLGKGSNLMLSLPDTGPPLLLERMAFKPLRTREGVRFGGLPLAGHYDDGLSRYSHR